MTGGVASPAVWLARAPRLELLLSRWRPEGWRLAALECGASPRAAPPLPPPPPVSLSAPWSASVPAWPAVVVPDSASFAGGFGSP